MTAPVPITNVGWFARAGSWLKGAFGFGSQTTVRFGANANQVSHAFRHTDELGLDRTVVQSAVQKHFNGVSSQIVQGKPFNQVIDVAGQRIQYTAFKLSDGTVNIGRIHGAP